MLWLGIILEVLAVRYLTPVLIFVLALTIGFLSIYGGGSYAALKSLERSLAIQKKKNLIEQRYVERLGKQIDGLQQDDRVLEKAARNELGMARPNELLFIFDNEEPVLDDEESSAKRLP
ncbi:MAG: hypothetical protein GX589_04260 [Deltaproteobacteria bacterium]|nr:hypothetical protein [Deltaproteobacteria bacterium]